MARSQVTEGDLFSAQRRDGSRESERPPRMPSSISARPSAIMSAARIGAGPLGRVFAFEAGPKNFAQLENHLGSFHWSTALNEAVWSITGNVIFERSSQPGECRRGTLTIVHDLA